MHQGNAASDHGGFACLVQDDDMGCVSDCCEVLLTHTCQHLQSSHSYARQIGLQAERASTSKGQQVPRVSAWLTLPDCLHGLRTILQQLTGVTLQEVPMLPGQSSTSPLILV